jgi:uncharacterized protein (TIGR02271 family)
MDRTSGSTNRTNSTTTGANASVNANETIAVPVHEEELTATKTAHEVGEVRIEKDVVAEEQVLNVPGDRGAGPGRAAGRRPAATGADAGAFQDEVIEVPVYGEEVQLQKQVRVAEEVEIGKEAVQRTEQVAGTVRREEVRVTDNVETGVEGVIGDGAAIIDPGAGSPTARPLTAGGPERGRGRRSTNPGRETGAPEGAANRPPRTSEGARHHGSDAWGSLRNPGQRRQRRRTHAQDFVSRYETGLPTRGTATRRRSTTTARSRAGFPRSSTKRPPPKPSAGCRRRSGGNCGRR